MKVHIPAVTDTPLCDLGLTMFDYTLDLLCWLSTSWPSEMTTSEFDTLLPNAGDYFAPKLRKQPDPRAATGGRLP